MKKFYFILVLAIHGLALNLQSEHLYTWGINNSGQLGDPNRQNPKVPALVGTSQDWKEISAGDYSTLAIKQDGTLWEWGWAYGTPTKINSDSWSKISNGINHTLGIKNDGSLWSKGSNYLGQLGDGTTEDKTSFVRVGNGNNWIYVHAGMGSSYAVKSDGTLWAWGFNYYGQLGDGTTEDRKTPVQIGNDKNWSSVNSQINYFHDGYYITAVKTDGTLWCWGDNSRGMFGDGTHNSSLVPKRSGNASNWLMVSCGYDYTMAVKTDGTLWAWGSNVYGVYGDPNPQYDNNEKKSRIGTGSDWIYVSCYYYHTVGLKSDGTLWVWGKELSGVNGDGTNNDVLTTLKVGTGTYWTKISAGHDFTAALYNTPPSPPTVVTDAISTVTSNSAFCRGYVSDEGTAPVTDKGVCWSASPEPTVANTKISKGAGLGNFEIKMDNLNVHTKYYVRAYATNSAGTAYGKEMSFTTLAELPKVTTSVVSEITATTAKSGGNVTYDGGDVILARGVCWSLNPIPNLTDGKSNDGTITGEFTSNMTGLKAVSKYFYRAYVTNSVGTTFGQIDSFTTLNNLPVIKTVPVTQIKTSSAVSGGIIPSQGDAPVTARGVCWSTEQSPTIENNKTSDGEATGSFESNITGLKPNTKYYVRAYAANSLGTAYGDELSFTTPTDYPVLTTLPVTNVSKIASSSGGNITDNGGAEITARGVCWSTSKLPTVENSKTSDGTGSGQYTSIIKNFNVNTVYYVRAYATNSLGTSYGNQLSFMYSENLPVLSTSEITDVAVNSATCGGTITEDGGESITSRGVCWSASEDPTVADYKTIDGSGKGTFTSSISGLKHNTKYFARSYATNSKGSAYGQQMEFKTKIQVPEMTYPSDNQTEIPVIATLTWNAVEENAKYRIQVSANELFDNFIVNEVVTETEFNLYDLNALTVYYWRLQTVIDGSGESDWTGTRNFTTENVNSVLNNKEIFGNIIKNISQSINSDRLLITYSIENYSNITLKLYNNLGMLTAALISNESLPSGIHTYEFDSGNLSKGVYFIEINVSGKIENRKILIY